VKSCLFCGEGVVKKSLVKVGHFNVAHRSCRNKASSEANRRWQKVPMHVRERFWGTVV
jgi:hypothetical protein